MIWLILALFAVIPHQGVIVDEADLVEINHVYGMDARPGSKPLFSQLIWFDWNEKTSLHEVVDWRMLKSAAMRPHLDERDGQWKAIWFDAAGGNCWRRVNAKAARETFGTVDPEIEQRSVLSVEKRRKLTMPKRPEINKRTTE